MDRYSLSPRDLLVRTGAGGMMPIYEYACKSCGSKFEAILMGSAEAECPQCKGKELEQQFSKFAVGAERQHSAPVAPCGMGGGCGGGKCPMA